MVRTRLTALCSSSDASYLNAGKILQPEESPTYVETWQAMEKLLEGGKVKSIGVSNFSIKTLDVLLPQAKIVPAVNQVCFSRQTRCAESYHNPRFNCILATRNTVCSNTAKRRASI